MTIVCSKRRTTSNDTLSRPTLAIGVCAIFVYVKTEFSTSSAFEYFPFSYNSKALMVL